MLRHDKATRPLSIKGNAAEFASLVFAYCFKYPFEKAWQPFVHERRSAIGDDTSFLKMQRLHRLCSISLAVAMEIFIGIL